MPAKRRKSRAVRVAMALVAIAIVIPINAMLSSSARAANGDNLRTITADTSGTTCPNVGTGIAFNGTSLLLSCWTDSTITFVRPSDGSQVSVHTISGVSGMGALAWDNGRGLLWACSSADDVTVGLVNLVTNVFTPKFQSQGCIDGLAYDAADDTIWASADVSPTVEHFTSGGTLLTSTPVSLGGCGNSGIAVGGATLYLANNGCSQIYTSNKSFSSPPALFASFPARLEDMECDDVTFAAQNVGAIWSKDAYDNTLNAWEIPKGSCTFGGGGDTIKPTCVLTKTISGPPKQIQVTVQDKQSGLASIVVTKAVNDSVSVPPFSVGTTSPVVVTATKIDQSLSSTLALQVKDKAGNVTNCDPTSVTVVRENRSQTLTGIDGSEHVVTIQNGSPGLVRLTAFVNGTHFAAARLKPGETRTINIASALRAGTDNTIRLVGQGRGGADILIWDGNGTP